MAKKIGLGIAVAYESTTPGTFTTVGEVYDVTLNEVTTDTVDVTDHSATDRIKRYIAALSDMGEFGMTLAYDPALTVYEAVQTIQLAHAIKNWKFTPIGGTAEVYPCIVTNHGRATPLDDRMTMDVTLKVAGPEVVS